MLLLHGEQVEFPAPTKAELGLQNGHSPMVESFGEWWDIQDDCDHGSSKPSHLRSERSRRTAADNLGGLFQSIFERVSIAFGRLILNIFYEFMKKMAEDDSNG